MKTWSLLFACILTCHMAAARVKNLGLQLAENPPMETISKTPPEPAIPKTVDIRKGFTLIETLDEFRAAIKKDGQKIRLKPGIYRAQKLDPPIEFRRLHVGKGDSPINEQQHIFAVTGSNNYFDLRGCIFETPVSVQSKMSMKAHVADCWHIDGANNVFEGGYFRNVLDMNYPKYRVAENEFEICNDGNTFLNCTFVITGSVPYGYTDFYGKGGPNYGRLNKHSFMSLDHANNTKIIGCKVYMKTFGHCIHFHKVDGVLIKDCFITGTLRPTNDIFKEKAGRAKDYGFNIMFRGKRPIPKNEIIPLTEDGIRAYNDVKNIKVVDTTVERHRGCIQLLCTGDITLENVTVREAGDFYFDLSAGSKGKVTMKNCTADLAYRPVFNLTRGDIPKNSFYEVTILDPAKGIKPTPRTNLGNICGERCTFILHDGTTRPLPKKYNVLRCGGRAMGGRRYPLVDSIIVNYTSAKLILERNVRNCTIMSVGPVVDGGKGNKVIMLKAPR